MVTNLVSLIVIANPSILEGASNAIDVIDCAISKRADLPYIASTALTIFVQFAATPMY
jgi:hypothetical protein